MIMFKIYAFMPVQVMLVLEGRLVRFLQKAVMLNVKMHLPSVKVSSYGWSLQSMSNFVLAVHEVI